MDHGSNTPKIYLKAPQMRTVSGSSNGSLPNYGRNGPSSGNSPTITYGSNSKASLFSQVVSAAGTTSFRSASSGTNPQINSRPPSRAQTSTSHYQQPYTQPRYSYGPSSTSASISSSTASRQGGHPTVNYASYAPAKSNQRLPPQSYKQIEYDSHREPNMENSLSIRNNPSAPIIYRGTGRGPKAPSQVEIKPKVRLIPRQPNFPGQNKFIQSSGLKVRREFADNQKSGSESEKKPILALMPAGSTNMSPRSLSTSPTSSPSNSNTGTPYVHAKIPSRITSRSSQSPSESGFSSPTEKLDDKMPKMFYSSLINPKSFSLSLSSKQNSMTLAHASQLNTAETKEEVINSADDSFNTDESGETSELDDNIGDITTDTSISAADQISDLPSDPKSLTDSQIKQARSNRKIMDLEISNASLMAVNKYLEKKLRSQSKDIQYLKVSNSSTSNLTGFDSESEDEDQEQTELQRISQDSTDDEQTVNGDRDVTNTESSIFSTAEIDIAEKTKMIQERMQSHIKFLESSEKVNSIMRNCLLISDSLIQQASKSLEYEVDPTDIKYGLHVSNHDFINDSRDTSFNVPENVSDSIHSQSTPQPLRLSSSGIDISRPILDDLIEESYSDLDDPNYSDDEDNS